MIATGVFVFAAMLATAHAQKPESYSANAQISQSTVRVASRIGIRIDRYTTEADNDALTKALKDGNYAAFVAALRAAPAVGAITVGERSIPIRWAREQKAASGRHIALVTEGPLFFAGGGAVDAKPMSPDDVGVLEFTVDEIGFGKGSMVGAAHVKPGGATGVQMDDYAGKRITLLSVTKNIS
jgi:hypothetical protein